MPKKKVESASVLKDNWYLIVAVVALLGMGAIAALMSGGEPEIRDQTGVVGQHGDVDIVRLSPEQLEVRETTTRYQGLSQAEKDQKYIEDYEAKLSDDPDGPKAAETMMSLAVVYRRQDEYNSAAIALEDLLRKFPESPNYRSALIMLPGVYEAAGDRSMARQTYRRMMDHFPAGSQEHQYATQRYDEL